MENCAACKNLSKTWDASQNLIVTRFNNKKGGRPLTKEGWADLEKRIRR